MSVVAGYERRSERRHEQFAMLLAEAELCIDNARWNFGRPNGFYGAPSQLATDDEREYQAVRS